MEDIKSKFSSERISKIKIYLSFFFKRETAQYEMLAALKRVACLVGCYVTVQAHLKDYFDEMQPVFKTPP